MLYAPRSDTRVRVRAANVHRLCVRLAGQLGAGWSQRPRRAARILSPICRFADPRAEVELEVNDDATGGLGGRRICQNLARAGWLDLSPP